MTNSQPRFTASDAAAAGALQLSVILCCTAIGAGIGALAGAVVAVALLGFFVGFFLGIFVVAKRFRSL